MYVLVQICTCHRHMCRPEGNWFFEIGCHYGAPADREFTMKTKVALNSQVHLPLPPVLAVKVCTANVGLKVSKSQ